jgi:hypothetical protein
MQLVKREEYKPDVGRSLTPEEFVQACREATHVSKIKSRSCWRESNNDHYRLGRR